MNTKNIRSFDEQGRVPLTKELAEFCNINKGEKIAICQKDEKRILLKKLKDVDNNSKIIGFSKTDSSSRIIIPKNIREGTQNVMVYLENGDLILEEVEEAH